MIWNVQGQSVPTMAIGELDPIDVLYEFDGPKIFVSKHEERLLLAYESLSDDAQRLIRLIVVPTNNDVLNRLKSGDVTLHAALDQPWIYVVDQSYEGEILAVTFVDTGLQTIPSDFRPMESALLWAHLKPKQSKMRPVAQGSIFTPPDIDVQFLPAHPVEINAIVEMLLSETIITEANGKDIDELIRINREHKVVEFTSYSFPSKVSPLPPKRPVMNDAAKIPPASAAQSTVH